jgi:hypothetical protein
LYNVLKGLHQYWYVESYCVGQVIFKGDLDLLFWPCFWVAPQKMLVAMTDAKLQLAWVCEV